MKILAITSTRADWGLLVPVLARLRDDPGFDLVLAVTGQHLQEPGLAAIAADGFAADHVIDLGLGAGDGAAEIARAVGAAMDGIRAIIGAGTPYMAMILSDNYATLAAVSIACQAHLCGWSVTRVPWTMLAATQSRRYTARLL